MAATDAQDQKVFNRFEPKWLRAFAKIRTKPKEFADFHQCVWRNKQERWNSFKQSVRLGVLSSKSTSLKSPLHKGARANNADTGSQG
eukprot:2160498-Amphidinium_carterae.1